jgi:acetoin utilization deacetylase AcuC-like enzyme
LSGGQGDDDYLNIFEEVLGPAIRKFSPEFILVSAGYDTYFRDPLGTMKVTENGFYRMTEFLKKIAIDDCNGRLFLALEGGYHIEGITESVKQTILALSAV